MFKFFTVRNLVLAGVVAAAGTISTQAHAGGYGYGGGYQNWAWKTVIVYEAVEQPVVHYVTRYASCGTPYQAKVVTYKTIRVPVEKQVKVYY